MKWYAHKVTSGVTALACGCGLMETFAIVAGSVFPDLIEIRIARNNPFIIRYIHRRFTHWWVLYLIGIIYLLYSYSTSISRLLAFFLLGCLAHIFQDSLTMGGVPVLNPFKPSFAHKLFYVGSLKELLYTLGYTSLCLLYIFIR